MMANTFGNPFVTVKILIQYGSCDENVKTTLKTSSDEFFTKNIATFLSLINAPHTSTISRSNQPKRPR